MKLYNITFENIFDFSLSTKMVELSEKQYIQAMQKKFSKDVVVSRLRKCGTRENLVIKSILEI